MIINIGIDIIEKKRMKILFDKYRKKIIKKIINKNEHKIFNTKKKYIEFLSKTFSIKETVSKILGTGFVNQITPKNIKITKNKLGKPIIKSTNKKVLISVSHDKNITITTGILLKINYNL